MLPLLSRIGGGGHCGASGSPESATGFGFTLPAPAAATEPSGPETPLAGQSVEKTVVATKARTSVTRSLMRLFSMLCRSLHDWL